jgi:hypothetical protein
VRGVAQSEGGLNEGGVTQRLWIVAQGVAAGRVDLLGIKAMRAAKVDELVE